MSESPKAFVDDVSLVIIVSLKNCENARVVIGTSSSTGIDLVEKHQRDTKNAGLGDRHAQTDLNTLGEERLKMDK